MRARELSGQTFGRLVVVGRVGSLRGRALWSCHCACGSNTSVTSDDLVSGNTTSCGCYLSEVRKVATLRHGHARHGALSVEYGTWSRMLDRCLNPKLPGWKNWGGRGITVCERWRKFENFLADMGPRPSPRHSIDRINNDGNYEPGNCRWATAKEQRANQRPAKPRAAVVGSTPLQVLRGEEAIA